MSYIHETVMCLTFTAAAVAVTAGIRFFTFYYRLQSAENLLCQDVQPVVYERHLVTPRDNGLSTLTFHQQRCCSNSMHATEGREIDPSYLFWAHPRWKLYSDSAAHRESEAAPEGVAW